MRIPVTQETLDRIKQSVAKDEGIDPSEVDVIHVSPSYTPCDHDWPDGDCGTDMNGCCTKCGMSFIRYIHTECP